MWRYCLMIVVLPLFAFEHNISDLYSVRLNPSRIDADKVFLLVDKSDYRMYVYEDVTLIKIYKVVFGSNSTADKFVQGDKRTPDGTFRISAKRFDKRWSRFMLLDYPNAESYSKFAQRQAEVFRQDLARSRRVTLEEWQNRPWREKLMEHAAGLLGSQL